MPKASSKKNLKFSIESAIYFDNDANGHVDSIFLEISGKELDNHIDEIMNNVELPVHRDFVVDSLESVKDGIALSVTENASEIRTFVTKKDFIEISDTIELADDVFLLPCKINIIDSVAPVIMEASLIDSAKEGAVDELTVKFSENTEDITKDDPFKFYSVDEDKVFDAELKVIDQNGKTGLFEVLSLDGVDAIIDGDSIRILWKYDKNIYDKLGNNQDNKKNIRREINVMVIEEGLKVRKGIYFDNNADGRIDSIYLQVYGEENIINSCLDTFVALISRCRLIITLKSRHF